MPKVLLVEDDNNLREIFQMRLAAEGYATATAADGEEGLVVAMKEKPELIIADVMMPKLSGFEMIENLRATPEMKDTKVIMMTALGQAEDQARGEKLGVVKYLVKSQVTLEDFARVVKEVLGPGDPQTAAAANQNVNQVINNQGSEGNMPPTSPSPDPSAPADPTPSPMGDAGQQSVDQEKTDVQGQIDSAMASAPSDSPAPEPAPESAAPAADPAAEAPSGDSTSMGAPEMPPTSEPPAPSVEPPAGGGEQPGPSGDSNTTNAL